MPRRPDPDIHPVYQRPSQRWPRWQKVTLAGSGSYTTITEVTEDGEPADIPPGNTFTAESGDEEKDRWEGAGPDRVGPGGGDADWGMAYSTLPNDAAGYHYVAAEYETMTDDGVIMGFRIGITPEPDPVDRLRNRDDGRMVTVEAWFLGVAPQIRPVETYADEVELAPGEVLTTNRVGQSTVTLPLGDLTAAPLTFEWTSSEVTTYGTPSPYLGTQTALMALSMTLTFQE